jgi:hypothetical protein
MDLNKGKHHLPYAFQASVVCFFIAVFTFFNGETDLKTTLFNKKAVETPAFGTYMKKGRASQLALSVSN